MLRPDSIELADMAARWRSAYVHIPFCRRRCPYCDFAVVAPEDRQVADIGDLTRRYLEALQVEIEMEQAWERLDAVNFGGGTPSSVGAAAIADLLVLIERHFGLADAAEVSVEVNPEDVTDTLVAELADIGVTRVSLGIQSFDDVVLEYLGRAHDAATAAVAVQRCLPAFSVGLDLIFGAPPETVASWASTVDRALELGPDHLSVYALTVERGTALWRHVASGAAAPDPDDQAEKYDYVQRAATAAGLIQYEVSNFARTGHACRYNLATWGQAEYVGFGLGAHAHRAGIRRRNVRSAAAYLDMVTNGRRPEAGREATADPEMERLILGLRRACGVELGGYAARAVADPAIDRLITAGVVAIEQGRLRVLAPLLGDEVGAAVLSLSP